MLKNNTISKSSCAAKYARSPSAKHCANYCALLAALLLCSCVSQNDPNHLVIFHAGSLSMPLKAVADSFKALNPKTTIDLEAAGSIDCARKITELGRTCDILASADYTVIDKLLIPEYATENIPFAGNEMAIVFTDKSKYADEITPDNWYKILLRPDVFYGRADPNADPCGYRTLLTLKLAQKHYAAPHTEKLTRHKTDSFALEQFTGKDTKFIRPKEVDLLALLDSRSIDYIFIYKSIAIQHGLRYLELPPEINLGDSSLAELYASVSVKVRGSKPGDSLTMTGTPMIYSLTIPKSAPNPALARKFSDFLLSPEGGGKILREMGQNTILRFRI